MEEPTVEKLDAYRMILVERIPRDKVGEKLGLSGRHAARWAKEVAEWMKAEHLDQIATLRSVLTDRLEYLYSESIRAYKLSKQPKVVRTEKTNADGDTEDTTQTTGQAAGNPAFLRLAKDAVEAHAELWHANMSAVDRQSGVRAAGRSQLDLVRQRLNQLRDLERSLSIRSGETVSGDGDRA